MMYKIKWIYVFLLVFMMSACAGADVKKTSSAPDFSLPDQNGKPWTLGATLKDYRAVVLAFYPKDDTGA